MRRLRAHIDPEAQSLIHRVVALDDLHIDWSPDLRFAVRTSNEHERAEVNRFKQSGLKNLFWIDSPELEDGDVIVPQHTAHHATVLLRNSDTHHSLQLTNRCNSHCLMCSQPPTKHNDSWLVDEALDAIAHLKQAPAVLGLTGGEPTLEHHGLRRVLDAVSERHPRTQLEVLTNGRRFSDPAVTHTLLHGLNAKARWLVPLYGHASFLHDFVVQAPGAFDETLAGLLALRAAGQHIQLRTVLVEPVLQILPELVLFITRNLPFVSEVALMGCEPIGFALANRSHCETDLSQWSATLEQSARYLDRAGIPFIFMNTPLCTLPQRLWTYAHKSISDWKNVYLAECESCAVKTDCSGLFSWHESGWRPAPLKPVAKMELSE